MKHVTISYMENQNKIHYSRGKNPNSHKHGYKKGHNSWLGKKLTEEHKQKLRISKLGVNNPMFGKKQTPEHILKRIVCNAGFRHTEQTKRIIGEKHKGNKTKSWKGDSVGYSGVHDWLRDYYGKADRCENKDCQQRSCNYQWANISKKYNRVRSDWIRLCVSCHQKWDRNIISIEL